MKFFNCGARGPDGKRIRTKKQLREMMVADPSQISFDGTSIFDHSIVKGNEIPNGLVLTVVMPDPFKDRRSYASVSIKADGTIKVS